MVEKRKINVNKCKTTVSVVLKPRRETGEYDNIIIKY